MSHPRDRSGPWAWLRRKAHKRWLGRYALAALYLRGEGIEIGALHHPLKVPPWVRVRYVDRLPVDELRRQYPELRDKSLVPVTFVDDGERLTSVPDASQDFVIASHFLEHCEDPIGALRNMLRVLRPGGVVYLVIPDQRFTFDRRRPVTPLAHLMRDHAEGPEVSRRGHFEEWARHVAGIEDEALVLREADRLEAAGYSIHFHVWTPREMIELLHHVAERDPLDLEVVVRRAEEVAIVARKAEAGQGLGLPAT